jgi:hypothetical protein
MEITHASFHKKIKFCAVKDYGYTYKLYFNFFFLDGAFEYGGGSNF